jgi:hypothetical protein
MRSSHIASRSKIRNIVAVSDLGSADRRLQRQSVHTRRPMYSQLLVSCGLVMEVVDAPRNKLKHPERMND